MTPKGHNAFENQIMGHYGTYLRTFLFKKLSCTRVIKIIINLEDRW